MRIYELLKNLLGLNWAISHAVSNFTKHAPSPYLTMVHNKLMWGCKLILSPENSSGKMHISS